MIAGRYVVAGNPLVHEAASGHALCCDYGRASWSCAIYCVHVRRAASPTSHAPTCLRCLGVVFPHVRATCPTTP